MENGLFRKKSMERISSPEELHDYMRVTSPRLKKCDSLNFDGNGRKERRNKQAG